VTDYENAKCGTCRHWHGEPTNAMTIGQPKRGTCRIDPPHATTLPVQGGLTVVASYPGMDEKFMACSRHEIKVVQIAAA